jgi:hypothetical protein
LGRKTKKDLEFLFSLAELMMGEREREREREKERERVCWLKAERKERNTKRESAEY